MQKNFPKSVRADDSAQQRVRSYQREKAFDLFDFISDKCRTGGVGIRTCFIIILGVGSITIGLIAGMGIVAILGLLAEVLP